MTSKQKVFFEVTLIYTLVGFLGWAVYILLDDAETLLRFFYADLVMTVATFIFSLIKRNSSVYDPYWSVIPFFFIVQWFAYFGGSDWKIYQWICAIVVSLWSWRLTLSWFRGFPGWHHEDWRYVNFRVQFGRFFQPINFLAIHLYPTLIVFLGLWPLFYVYDFGEIRFPALFYFGAFVALLGVWFEYVADNQLDRFRKRDIKRPEDILKTGIWSYSRNPNYFGEIIFWFGLLGMGLAFGAPWYTALGSIGMLLMFLFASIPMKEKQMLKKRPEAFKKYKSEVSVLFPLPPKSKPFSS
jgi:steroid 5-alpha reductase family enzyme